MSSNGTERKTPRGHTHAEAFCWMEYWGQGSNGSAIRLLIYNSRDGVTPFMTACKEYGIELQHVNWRHDRYDPDYKPKKGDLIWRDFTKEEAIELGKKYYKTRQEEYLQLKDLSEKQLEELGYGYDPRPILQEILKQGEEAAIQRTIKELIDNKQPKLELIK